MSDVLTIINSGKLGGTGKLVGNIDNSGTVFAQAGTYLVEGSILGAGVLEVDTGGLLSIKGSVTGQTINFNGVGATLLIGNPGNLNVTVNGFQTGDMIVLEGFPSMTQSFDAPSQTLTMNDLSGVPFDYDGETGRVNVSRTSALFREELMGDPR